MFDRDKYRDAIGVIQVEATLRDLKRCLGGSGVPFLVLKGVHLGAAYYPRPEQRTHDDIDILVRPTHFTRACAALMSAGFSRMGISDSRKATERNLYNYGFVSPIGHCVEVHRAWAGYGRYPMDIRGMFNRAVRFRYGNTELLGLCAEDLLLHLCVHMAKGYFAFQGFKHLQDVSVLLQGQKVDWKVFIARAREARCEVGAYYALLAAREQCGAPVPEILLREMRPAAWRRRWIAKAIDPTRFPLTTISPAQLTRLRLCLTLPLLDRPSDWARVLVRFLRVRAEDLLRPPPRS